MFWDLELVDCFESSLEPSAMLLGIVTYTNPLGVAIPQNMSSECERSSAYAGDHGLGPGGMRNSGWES